MRKFVLLFSLLIAYAVSAQDNYYTMYSFVVEPQDEGTVYQLVDDYYSKNKPEGVFVRLFENHFQDGSNNATHHIVFLGTQEAVGKMYEGSNDKFALFLTQLNQHIKEGAGSALGRHISLHGLTDGQRYPAQRIYLLDVDNTEAFDREFNKFQLKHNPDGVLVNLGTPILGQGAGKYNRWVIVGYKDIGTAIGGTDKLVSGAALEARLKARDERRANNGEVKLVGSGMRILLGAW